MHVLDKALGPAADRDQGYVGYNDGSVINSLRSKTVRQICDLPRCSRRIYWREAATIWGH